jgi:PEP-CTERM motif
MAVKGFASALAVLLVVSANVLADAIPYPSAGTENPVTYTFTAASTGHVIAYFAGSSASYHNEIGLLDNGVLTPAGFGLENHTSVLGQSFDMGLVTAGDTLTFVMRNDTYMSGGNPFGSGDLVYSDKSLNAAYDGLPTGHNHIYSTPYTGTGPVIDAIPPGTFVSFEDFPASRPPDWNYNDEDFVFTNVAATSSPEPATLSMLGAGIVGLCGYAWRKRKVTLA